jgi:hypothetical protein
VTILQRWKQTALHNKALVGAGLIAAFGTVFYAGAAIVQVCIMNRSASESSEQIANIYSKAQGIIESMRATQSQMCQQSSENVVF